MMTQMPVLTALNLPAVSVLPSVNSVQWTGDGQILLLTKLAVHILVRTSCLRTQRFYDH